MKPDDPTPPVAEDDFPEFSAPPKHKPAAGSSARAPRPEAEPGDSAQAAVDDVIARIKKRKAEDEA